MSSVLKRWQKCILFLLYIYSYNPPCAQDLKEGKFKKERDRERGEIRKETRKQMINKKEEVYLDHHWAIFYI